MDIVSQFEKNFSGDRAKGAPIDNDSCSTWHRLIFWDAFNERSPEVASSNLCANVPSAPSSASVVANPPIHSIELEDFRNGQATVSQVAVPRYPLIPISPVPLGYYYGHCYYVPVFFGSTYPGLRAQDGYEKNAFSQGHTVTRHF